METTFWTPGIALTPAGAQTLNIPDTIIPQGQAVQYLLYFSKSTFADVDRIRVLANGQTTWDVSNAAFLATIQRFSANHMAILGAGHYLPLPFYLTDQKGANARYASQVPPGARMSIQLDLGAGVVGTETVDLLTTFTTVPCLSYPTLISNPTSGVVATGVNQIVQIKQNVLMRGFYLADLAHITRIELNASGLMLYNGCSGPSFAYEQIMHQNPDAASLVVDGQMNKVGPVSVGGDGTQLLLSTAGYTPGSEYAIYGAVPVAEGK
jgi:hypothetical protein